MMAYRGFTSYLVIWPLIRPILQNRKGTNAGVDVELFTLPTSEAGQAGV